MKKLFFLIVNFVLIHTSAQDLVWADRIKSGGNNHVFNVKVDSTTGETYATGRVKEIGTFGELTNPQVPFTYGDRDIYLTKNDVNGDLLWVKRFGGLYTDYGQAIEISSDYIYLSGYFTDTCIVDNDTLFSVGMQDAYMIKMNKSGGVIWAKSWGSEFDERIVESFIDTDENVYITGYFVDSISFDGIDLINTIPLTYPIRQPSFLVKLDSSGTAIWAEKQQSTLKVKPLDVTVKDGFVYLVGNTVGNTEFGGIPYLSTGLTWFDQFLAKYDENGNCIWAKLYGNNLNDTFTTIQSGDGNDLYAAGYFKGIVTYGADTYSTPGQSGIALKFDTSGTVVNSFEMVSSNPAEFDGIAYANNCVFFGGYFWDTLFVGIDTIVGMGGYDPIIVVLDTNMNVITTKTFAGTSFEQIRCLTMSPNGNVAVGGSFRGTVDFDAVIFTAAAGNYDGFVTVYCPPLMAEIEQSDSVICTGETITFNNNTKGISTLSTAPLPLGASVFASSDESITLEFSAAGSFSIKTYVNNSCNLDSVEFNNIEVVQTPTLDLGPDIYNCDSLSSSITAIGVYDSIYWSTGDTDTNLVSVGSSATYYAEAWNNGTCIFTDTIEVSIGEQPSVDLGFDIVDCDTHTVCIYASGIYDSIVWNNGQVNIDSIATDTSGIFVAQVWQDGACSDSDTIVVTISDCSSIQEHGLKNDDLFYSEGTVHIVNIVGPNADYVIYDMRGRAIQNGTILNSSIPIRLSVPEGVYVIQITENGAYKKLKFIHP